MNKFYVAFPALLLIAFCVYYTQVAKPEMEAKEAAAIQDQKNRDDADAARRQAIEEKARDDALKQNAAREAKDNEKKEQIRLKNLKQDNDTKEETEKYEAQAKALTKQIADMAKETEMLRTQRTQLSRDVFAAAAKVELAKTDRVTAELEIQRMYAMVAEKVGDSFLTKSPPLPVVAPK